MFQSFISCHKRIFFIKPGCQYQLACVGNWPQTKVLGKLKSVLQPVPDEGVSGDSSWESFECQDVLIKTKNVILMVTGRKVRGLPNSEELILWMLLISHPKCMETADSCERISVQSSRPIGRHRHYVAFMGKNDIFSLAYAWMYIKRIELKFFFQFFTRSLQCCSMHCFTLYFERREQDFIFPFTFVLL